MEYELSAPPYRLPCLSRRFTYSCGHVLNDLAFIVFTNYALLYLVKVAQLPLAYTGYILLVGQAVSAIAGVLSEQLAQRHQLICCCYTRRKGWHLVGVLLVIVGVLFLFMPCIQCADASSVVRTVYYGVFILTLQLGWAIAQSSHLGLIPEITRNPHERIELNALRYTVSVFSYTVIFSIVWLLFALAKGDDDHKWFTILGAFVAVVGFFAAVIFHLGTEETNYDLFLETHLATASFEQMTSRHWVKQPQYYQLVFLHLFTRLSVNIAVMYLPLYLADSLSLPKDYLACVPFVAMLATVFFPYITKPLAKAASPKLTYLMGAVLVMGVGAWVWFIKSTWPLVELQAFGLAVGLGAGGGITTLSSLTMARLVVGDKTEAGNFVFSSMGIVEKVATGVGFLVIQQLNSYDSNDAIDYYCYVLVFAVGGAAAAGFLIGLTFLPVKLGQLRNLHLLESAFRQPSSQEAEGAKDGIMAPFERTPEEDCFNYWWCLSGSLEGAAHGIAICGATSRSLRYHLTNYSSSPPGVATLPKRSYSYESMDTMVHPAALRSSASLPDMIEYSGNFERHHRQQQQQQQQQQRQKVQPLKQERPVAGKQKEQEKPKVKPTKPSSRQPEDKVGLVDNEELPEPTMPPATSGETETPVVVSADVHVHPPEAASSHVTNDVKDDANNDVKPDITIGTPYDNVPVTVTPGGKILSEETS